MPIYEFHCAACDEAFERIVQAGTDRPPCPDCGSDEVTRQVSAFSARTSVQRRGRRVVDLSSGACPCGGHAHRRPVHSP